MTQDELREFEQKMQAETNEKVLADLAATGASETPVAGGNENLEAAKESEEDPEKKKDEENKPSGSGDATDADSAAGGYGISSAASGIKSWFSWS